MTTIIDKTSVEVPLPNNWKKEGAFSADDVINAYLRGRNDGKDQISKELTDRFLKNLKKAIAFSEEVYDSVNKGDLHLSKIHLRAENMNNFSALFVTNLKEFVSEKFRSVYRLSRKIKEKAIGEDFYISFSFMPDSKNLNQDCLTADGYFLKYEEKQREIKSWSS